MARSRTRSASRTPPAKRVKLETPPPSTLTGPYIKSDFEEEDLVKAEPELMDGNSKVALKEELELKEEEMKADMEADEDEEDEDADRCSICLQPIADRTVVPLCAHEFCFDCLIVWTAQSRRCPLCSQAIGAFLIHRIRSRFDYQKHFLSPLPTSPRALPPPQLPLRQRAPRRRRSREWGRGRAENAESDKLDRSIARRRWVYEHDLYAKHVASNAYTRYRPYPNPAQFAASPELVSRTTIFLRRELQVWVNLDVEFLTTFILSIMKALDIRSEGAVKLLAEFLDLDAPGPYEEGGRHRNAEHFAHEVYTYVRSPYRDLFVYDSVVQYDVPPNTEVPPHALALPLERGRWERENGNEREHEARRETGREAGRRREYENENEAAYSPARDGGRRTSGREGDVKRAGADEGELERRGEPRDAEREAGRRAHPPTRSRSRERERERERSIPVSSARRRRSREKEGDRQRLEWVEQQGDLDRDRDRAGRQGERRSGREGGGRDERTPERPSERERGHYSGLSRKREHYSRSAHEREAGPSRAPGARARGGVSERGSSNEGPSGNERRRHSISPADDEETSLVNAGLSATAEGTAEAMAERAEGKGKGKARALSPRATTRAPTPPSKEYVDREAGMDMQVEVEREVVLERTVTPPPLPRQAPRILSRSRNWSLAASVQAHLNLGGGGGLAERKLDRSKTRGASTVVVDSGGARTLRGDGKGKGEEEESKGVDDRVDIREDKQGGEDKEREEKQEKESKRKPSLLARLSSPTRAGVRRPAKRDGKAKERDGGDELPNAIQDSKPSSAPLDLAPESLGQTPTPASRAFPQTPSDSEAARQTKDTGANGKTAVLLRRLEEEKERVADAGADVSVRNTKDGGTDGKTAELRRRLEEEKERAADAAEARLRRQAQLRVRLAAEKRSGRGAE